MSTEIDKPLPGGGALRPAIPPDGLSETRSQPRVPAPVDDVTDEPAATTGTARSEPTAQPEPAAQAEPGGHDRAAGDEGPQPPGATDDSDPVTGGDGLAGHDPRLTVRRRRAGSAHSRPPASHRPPPPNSRMLGLCAWATGIGFVGLAVALRGLGAVLDHTGPPWYEPTMSGVGLAGVGLMLAAFLSAKRVRLPWVMLALATVPVAINLGLTLGAL